MKPEEITRESMQALAEKTASPVGNLMAWQVRDRLNASMNLNGHEGATLPKMGQTLALPATDEQIVFGIRTVLIRKITARYWLRVVIG